MVPHVTRCDHIDTKRREFSQKYRRYPGIPRLTRWGRAYITKEQLVRQLRSSRPPSGGLTWNLIESPHFVDDMGEFITVDMHLAIQSKDGFSSYILKVACDGRNIAYVILTQALFNDLFVTPQPRGFYSELNSNFVQGKNKWLPLRPGARKQDIDLIDLSELPPLLHVTDRFDLDRVGFIQFYDSAREVSCKIESFCLLCAWCAVLNAADALGRDIRKAIEVIDADMLENPDNRHYEGMSLKQISFFAPTLHPGLKRRKMPETSAEELVMELSQGPVGVIKKTNVPSLCC